MMCQSCKDGGTFSFQAKDRALKKRDRKNLTDSAERLHSACADPNTCTCQHKVGR